MIQGQAVKILLLFAGPIIHRRLNDRVMDTVYARCLSIRAFGNRPKPTVIVRLLDGCLP